MSNIRDQKILVFAGVVGLIVGGLAGIAGGFLVSTGRIGPLERYLPSVRGVVERTGNAGGASRGPALGAIMGGEEEHATIDVVRSASPAVVSIVVRKEVAVVPRGNFLTPFGSPFNDLFEFGIPNPAPAPQPRSRGGEGGEKQQVGGGSGFMVTSDGYIVTNRHVVADPDAEYAVLLSDDREFPAKVLAKDPLNDLAILKIDVGRGGGSLPVLELGDSDQVQIGETVIAIGYALSEFRNTVTKGVISGINRRVVAGDGSGASEIIQEAMQTDAAINPGNSGGPLLNLRGQVIGVNTAVSREGQLIGFSIPINLAKYAIESVIRDGKIIRPWLGVRYLVVTERLMQEQKLPVDHGALVVRGTNPTEVAVTTGSPAAHAGLRENDIVTAVDGEPVDENHPLANRIARRKPGNRVTLTVLRKGKEKQIDVTLGEFPE